MVTSDLPFFAANLPKISKKESKSCENNSSLGISVDCIQLIVGTFSSVSLDSFFKIEQDYFWSFSEFSFHFVQFQGNFH